MKTVFLGGTCGGSTWRNELVKQLNIGYYNPVVDDWTPECMKEEIRQREICDYCLFVITPKMSGVYSIAEAIDDSNKKPEKTIFCYLNKDDGISFTEGQAKSIKQVGKMAKRNGAKYFTSLAEVSGFLNNQR